jgi:nitrogen fixation/metabolism regulation signal transduction histidine kinase
MKRWAFIIWLLALAVTAAGIAVCIFFKQWALLVVSSVGLALSVAELIRLYGNSARKVKFLLDSVRSNDFSFNFATGQKSDDQYINIQLNQIRDILQKARQDAVAREKYYELILNSINTGVIAEDEHGNIFQSNDAARRIFGLEVLTNVAQTRRVSDQVSSALMEIKAGEKRNVAVINEKGEYNISMRASEVTMLGVAGSSAIGASGGMSANSRGGQDNSRKLRVIVLSDINSELAEKELDSWQRLIRVMTHEIMNSLSPITSLSSSLLDICEDKKGDMARGLATINSTSSSLISFIDDYRRFTHLPVPQKKAFNLSDLVSRVLALGGDNSQYVSVSITPSDIMLYADEDLIGQVLINVIKNAFAAIEGSGAVAESSEGDVGASQQARVPAVSIVAYLDADENPTVEITDNGPAIPADSVENIFMPFYTTKPDGSGIGLSLSRQIMRLHDGSIRLTSNVPGRVTFTLQFR